MEEREPDNEGEGLHSNPYTVGIEAAYSPTGVRYRHMLYLVAYDIRQPRRLHRVAKVCENYGIRVEYSVFECDLDETSFSNLWYDLAREIEPEEDTILAYRICSACVQRISSLGATFRPAQKLVYML